MTRPLSGIRVKKDEKVVRDSYPVALVELSCKGGRSHASGILLEGLLAQVNPLCK